jgi:hypothetical protein
MTYVASPDRAFGVLVILSALLLAACSASTTSSEPSLAIAVPAPSLAAASPTAEASVAPTESPSAAPEDNATAEASAAAQATAVPTDIDPCQLVTTDEASALAGMKLAAGTVSTANNTRICSYGAEGTVMQVLVAVAPDAATAKAGEADFKAQLERGAAQAGIVHPKLTELSDFEPGVDAAVISGDVDVSGTKVSGIALYALKNAVVVAISDISLGGSAPSSDAMQAQAHTTLSRLP